MKQQRTLNSPSLDAMSCCRLYVTSCTLVVTVLAWKDDYFPAFSMEVNTRPSLLHTGGFQASILRWSQKVPELAGGYAFLHLVQHRPLKA